jgi:hypothetical protein
VPPRQRPEHARPSVPTQFYILWVRLVVLRARFTSERREARQLRRLLRSSSGSDVGGDGGRGGAGAGASRPGAASESRREGAEDVGCAVDATTRWLDAAAGARLRLAIFTFGGVSALLGTLVAAEAAALFGPRLCAAP